VKDRHWSLAVESGLGSYLLRGFVVASIEDFRVFEFALSRLGIPKGSTPIYIQKPTKRYANIPRYSFHEEGVQTVLEQLVIEHDWIFCVIVDQCNPENIVLVPDNLNAFTFTRSFSNVNSNFSSKMIVSTDGSKYVDKSGSIACFPFEKTHGILNVDITSQLSNLEILLCAREQEMFEIDQQLSHAENEHKQLNLQVTDLNRQRSSKKKTFSQLSFQISNIDTEIRDLESDSSSFDDSFLQVELRGHLQKLADLKAELETIRATLIKSEEQYTSAREKISELKRHIEDLQTEAASLKTKAQNAVLEESELEDELVAAKNQMNVLQINLTSLEKSIESDEKRLSDLIIETQESFGDRPKGNLDAKKIKEKLVRMETEMKVGLEKLDASSVSELGRRCEDAKSILQLHQKKFQDLQDVQRVCVPFFFQLKAQQLEDKIVIRQQDYVTFLKKLTKEVSLCFHEFVSTQGYEGTLNISHDQETLDFEIRRRGSESSITNDARSLSGGERSFCTICMIAAIAENLLTPFICLDEFDVFMV
jgi:chromosome segregation ATPase